MFSILIYEFYFSLNRKFVRLLIEDGRKKVAREILDKVSNYELLIT